MNYSIIFSSHTGNTELIAERIKTIMHGELVYYGEPTDIIPDCDLICIGFWTNRGTCNEEILDYLQKLNNKKIFLFGTAGFGVDNKYFNDIIKNVSDNINNSNTIVDTFMCQGKMPLSVREKYVRLKESSNPPDNIDLLIENYDNALLHPTADDLVELTSKILALKEI